MRRGWRIEDITLRLGVEEESGASVSREHAPGYTPGMKTAISLPDDVFGEAEGLATQLRISRSELYGRALKEFLARHAPDRVTDALDDLCGALDTRPDGFVTRSARRTLGRNEW